MKLIPKINAKSIGVNVKMEIRKNANGKDVACAVDNDHNRVLFRIAGIASAMEAVPTNFGESFRFIGQFRATLRETGEEFHSGAAFLPPMAANLLRGMLTGATAGVGFAFDIGVQGDPDSAVGYVWTVTPLTQPNAESDPIALLLKAANVPALEAPKSDAPAQDAPAQDAPAEPATKGKGKK